MLLFCARDSAIQVSQNDREIENRKPKNIVREHIKTQKEVRRMSKESRKIPMNLQFFAEPGEQDGQQTPPADDGKEQDGQQTPPADDGKEPTVQELMVELAKVKKAQERAASEAAEYKKKYNAKLSEKERVDAEKAEREAEREEQFQQLLRENKINKLEKYYLGELKYTPDEASQMAIAEVDDDFDAKLKIQLAVDKRKKKEYEAEFIKSRPQMNAGTGDGKVVTLEQFTKMGVADRVKLKRSDPDGYERLRKAEQGGK